MWSYRFTPVGWIGAILFVLPTPLAAWEYHAAIRRFASRGADYRRALAEIEGRIPMPEFSPVYFTALATLTLIGLVMVIVGRRAVQD